MRKRYPDVSLNQEAIGKINKLIHDNVYQEGYLCIHNFDIVDMAKKITTEGGKLRVLGVSLGNPYTVVADFSNHIAYLDKKAEKIIESI